ncbi:threonine synthase [Paenibacillus psychroresistens]|uniref:Threonine synthase n=1 Tax=Paenibacillus psychroresistens TaxID=1778678 RepID=A0A6B8RSL1_9BACL|nr:threonine synthase [Paenibacillus psychroresistens]QGQ98545.1 threonine synthase [Paenibacillus psychroresistens]
MKLICFECKSDYSDKSFQYQCHCGGLFQVVHDFKAVDSEKLRRMFAERLSQRMSMHASGVWRYKELIYPELPEAFVTTKYEGNTGLYASESLQAYTGVRQVWLKAQSENPSGSFKDNGMTVAVSHARSLGKQKLACSSTGNTSSSLAMYAALAGCKAYVYVPERQVSENKIKQTLAYGAEIIRIAGTYDDGIRFLEQNYEELGLYVCNSINPWRIEGQKSMIYEAAQSLNWKIPDWIIVPGGALSNAVSLGKGLNDLYMLGFIDHLPKVAVVQAEGASPFHRMIEGNHPTLIPELQPQTIASAMNIGNLPSWRKAQAMLSQTKGVTVSVTDEEILAAKQLIDRSGIGCEPASAATVAGLRKLTASLIIDPDETALCVLTGHILKDFASFLDYDN